MPIAAIICTAFGDIYACHGGLSPSLKKIEDIENIDRFVEPEGHSGLLDILWSDPISEDSTEQMTDEQYQDFLSIDWKSNPTRGCSYCFGYKAVREFLKSNGLVCIVRAHEVQEDGYRRHFDPAIVEARLESILQNMSASKFEKNLIDSKPLTNESTTASITHSSSNEQTAATPTMTQLMHSLNNLDNIVTEKDFPPVITIFSAPNYCDRYGNKGAVLRIGPALDELRVIQYDCVEHPVPNNTESQTDNYLEAVINACPYLPTTFRNFIHLALQLGPDHSIFMFDEDNNIDDEENDENLKDRLSMSNELTESQILEINNAVSSDANDDNDLSKTDQNSSIMEDDGISPSPVGNVHGESASTGINGSENDEILNASIEIANDSFDALIADSDARLAEILPHDEQSATGAMEIPISVRDSTFSIEDMIPINLSLSSLPSRDSSRQVSFSEGDGLLSTSPANNAAQFLFPIDQNPNYGSQREKEVEGIGKSLNLTTSGVPSSAGTRNRRERSASILIPMSTSASKRVAESFKMSSGDLLSSAASNSNASVGLNNYLEFEVPGDWGHFDSMRISRDNDDSFHLRKSFTGDSTVGDDSISEAIGSLSMDRFERDSSNRWGIGYSYAHSKDDRKGYQYSSGELSALQHAHKVNLKARKKSYMQALASDSINEYHPQALPSFIKVLVYILYLF